jgi:hypothetical protein
MDTADELARIISEFLHPRRGPLTADEQKVKWADWVVERFERRAREIDGDSAPTGVDAIQLKYHPDAPTASTSEIDMERLRRVVRHLLKLRPANAQQP